MKFSGFNFSEEKLAPVIARCQIKTSIMKENLNGSIWFTATLTGGEKICVSNVMLNHWWPGIHF